MMQNKMEWIGILMCSGGIVLCVMLLIENNR